MIYFKRQLIIQLLATVNYLQLQCYNVLRQSLSLSERPHPLICYTYLPTSINVTYNGSKSLYFHVKRSTLPDWITVINFVCNSINTNYNNKFFSYRSANKYLFHYTKADQCTSTKLEWFKTKIEPSSIETSSIDRRRSHSVH